jgi:hypothetical protein
MDPELKCLDKSEYQVLERGEFSNALSFLWPRQIVRKVREAVDSKAVTECSFASINRLE